VISGRTRLVALIGHPVGESLSPRMQNAAFAARGLDWTYVALDVEEHGLHAAALGLAAMGFAGANVTAPYKIDFVELCDVVDPEAERAGSVNTLVVRDEQVHGYSTDAAILEGRSAERAVVIGGGGAAKAFSHALPGARVFSRRGDWPPDASDADLVVNATPVRDEVLVELRRGQTLVDLPYPASATAEAAREAGATVIDGLDVLVAQGAAAFELWTGIPAPVEVMRTAVRS
jgi:shikimate dehydrogenase